MEGVHELGRPSARTDFYMVHDDGILVEALLDFFAGHKTWKPAVAFSRNPPPTRVVNALHAGVMDYLDENFGACELRETFARVAMRARRQSGARQAALRARSCMSKLSPREHEVMAALSEGLTSKLIAERLRISSKTVEIHRANALGKLGAANSYEAVRIVVEAEPSRI